MYFKSRLKILAAEKDLSLAEVSQQTKIGRIFIYNLANGKIDRVPVKKLRILKDFFKCQISDLLDFPDENIESLKTVDNQEEYILNSSQKNNIK